MAKAARNSNIELLRILAMLGIVFLHYQNADLGGAIKVAENENYELLLLLKSIAVTAVNIFVLITGYFSFAHDEQKVNKVFALLVQTIAFRQLIYGLRIAVGSSHFSLRGLFLNFLPLSWFIVVYCALVLISPYLNVVVREIDRKQFRQLLLVGLLLFSVWPFCVDLLQTHLSISLPGLSTIGRDGSQNGYTIVQFVLLYYVGAFIGKYKIHEKISQRRLLCVFVVSFVGLYIWLHYNTRNVTEYCNPIVIGEAAVIFMIFCKLKFVNKAVNGLARASFTVYLTHLFVIDYLNVERYAEADVWIFAGHILLSIIIMYLVGWGAWLLWDLISKQFAKIYKGKTILISARKTMEE